MSNTIPADATGLRVISAPTVYLLSKQTLQHGELDRFLADHGVTWSSDSTVASEVVAETAGRVCYMSYAKPRPGGNAAYLGHIKEVGHGSVFEHAVWTFLITGVSRSLTHELVRHRAGWAYSQLSQRYVDESVAEYVEPDIIASDPELHAVWSDAVAWSHKAYVELADRLYEKVKRQKAVEYLRSPLAAGIMACNPEFLEPPPEVKTAIRKAARQAARSVLPNATETKITVTANARALRHFLEQRGSVHAEPEIRKLANVLLEVLVKDAPNLFGDYKRTPLPDGTFEITTDHPKV
jgi:thymidylate synthase (FAD)